MPITPHWEDLLLRIILSFIGGSLIGLNRGEHGKPAGLCTVLLVTLAAAFSMIEANLLMNMSGKAPDSFIDLDVMRLPLGILSGIGFIGAGAIIKKEDLVIGITTAATLWFSTVMGLCFGAGFHLFGLCILGIGLSVLWGMKRIEQNLWQDRRGTLLLKIRVPGLSEQEIRSQVEEGGVQIQYFALNQNLLEHICEYHLNVQWRAHAQDTQTPSFLHEFSKHPQTLSIEWRP